MLRQTIPGRIDLIALHEQQPERYPCLLAGTARAVSHTGRNRFDILFAFPNARLELGQDGRLRSDNLQVAGDDFLQALDHCRLTERQSVVETSDTDLPFQGGWFLFLGYELVNQIEPTVNSRTNPNSRLPVACALRIPAAVIYDHVTDQTHLIAEAGCAECLTQMSTDLAGLAGYIQQNDMFAVTMQEEDAANYLDGVSRVKNYIANGDVFQVNLSREWQGDKPAEMTPANLFRQLARTNPAPFAGLARLSAQAAIVSSSPERLVRTRAGVVETRPIAGTRPRGRGMEVDNALLSELIGHPKERAEHIMLIDLERNDLGRVCRPGSIKVNELMALESYAHVHHIVSNIRGELRDGISPGEVIRAVFPGGTITGCPKVRCMAIIAELEQGARGAYTGSMGYLNHSGEMDLNILIRTIVLDGGTIRVRAGAGLVADSDAQNELDETRAKAKGMLLSLQTAVEETPSI